MAGVCDRPDADMEHLPHSESGIHLGIKSIHLSYPTSKLVSGLHWDPILFLIMRPCIVGSENETMTQYQDASSPGAGNSLIQAVLIKYLR